MDKNRIYIAIDLKSFYASVECVKRGLDPLDTNLVVADGSRTEKTICLAVSPSLKAHGISGRARLFEVVQKMKEVNADRLTALPSRTFYGESVSAKELKSNPQLKADYIVAPPCMAHYVQCSTQIYSIYLKYIAPEDIHVYSIDEVFIDATDYLKTYKMTPRRLAMAIISDVLQATGITATAGIGTNMYLCKVAMDIVAKKMPPDKNGVRIALLDEIRYRRLLWDHRPLTDFWRVGRGYAKKLEAHGLYTMGDIARCSLGKETEHFNEDLLYKLFGVNAELLIDHAWGYEPCTIADVKAYKPQTNSLCTGQVLQCPYPFDKAKLICHEMADFLALDLVDKRLVTDQLILTIGYDTENVKKGIFKGEIKTDVYGRKIPKHAHGTVNLKERTSSAKQITEAVLKLFDEIADPDLTVRRVNITANRLISEELMKESRSFEQLDFFMDYERVRQEKEKEQKELRRERKRQEAVLSIKKKFGKNAILKGTNFKEGATGKDRNKQIGGHKA